MTSRTFEPVDVQPLVETLWQLLSATPNVNVFDGEPDIPAYDPDRPETAKFWDLDETGQPVNVHAYACFYPGAGLAHATTLEGAADRADLSFQVTCVGADRRTALWCANRVRQQVTGVWVTFGGQDYQVAEEGDAGPVRRDNDLTPPRYWLPLLYRIQT